MVLGGHGDDMAPCLDVHDQRRPRDALHQGRSHDGDHRAHAQRRRRNRGTSWDERLLRPASSRRRDGKAYLGDQKRLLACAAYLEGSTATKTSSSASPAIIGKGGVEKILEIPLSAEEKGMLGKSAKSVQSVVDVCKKS